VINGVDYPTADGTCVRDFIHVVDVARAHVVALAALDESLSGLHVFNIGTGHGYSVKEMIAAFEAAAHRTIPIRVGARRDGDVVVAIADPTKIERELGWHAEHTLQDIAESAVKGAYYGM
jgi:UDP-glucose 4-epimerase